MSMTLIQKAAASGVLLLGIGGTFALAAGDRRDAPPVAAEQRKENISIEAFESIIHAWARNLYMLNNSGRIAGDESRIAVLNEFHREVGRGANRRSTVTADASEKGFIAASWGVALLGTVSRPAAEAISASGPVDAWRRSVARDIFQPHFDAFESILGEALARHGEAAVLAQYPQTAASARGVIGTFEAVGYTSNLPARAFVELVDKASVRAAAGHPPRAAERGLN